MQSDETINAGPVWLNTAQSTEALLSETLPAEYIRPNIRAEEGVPHSAVSGAAKRQRNDLFEENLRKTALEVM